MTVKYRHTSGTEREFGGRQRRLENSDEWELVQDNAPVSMEGRTPSARGGVSIDAKTGEPTDEPDRDAESNPIAGDPPDDDTGESFPVYKGGGHYELSDGSTVQGKEDAEAAQAELDAANDEG